MLVIPEEIQAILKNGQAIGDRRPTGTLTVSGQPEGRTLVDPTSWTTWQQQGTVENNNLHGNCAENINGIPMMVYREGDSGNIKVAYGTDWVSILSGVADFNFATALTITTGKNRAITRVSRIGNELFLVVVYSTAINELPYIISEFWRDATGVGDSFAFVSTISDLLGYHYFDYWGPTGHDPTTADTNWIGVSEICKLTNGNLVQVNNSLDPVYQYIGSYVSTDDGVTWTGATRGNSLYGRTFMSGIVEYTPNEYGVFVYFNNGSEYFYPWDSSGGSIEAVATSNWTWGASIRWSTLCKIGNEILGAFYGDMNIKIGRYVGATPITADLLADGANWELVVSLEASIDGDYTQKHLSVCGNQLILSVEDEDQFYIAGTYLSVITIPIKSIAIDRSKGEASKATIVLDNKNGIYAPDNNLSDWYQVLWFNKQIELTLGYGDEQPIVYTGLIDDIKMDTYPVAQLTVYSRDMSKLALDQQIAEWFTDHWAYVVIYQWQTLEYIFNDLALGCGFAAGAIHAEVTGITQAELKFSHQSYADGFQELCELSGFEWFCDEIGDIWFRKAVEPAPVAVYEYIEGVDIFSLGYLLSDAEIARNIIAYSKDVNGTFLRSDVEWSAANYNAVLPKKTIFVDATDIASTAEDVAALAQENADALDCKPRSVDFVVPCNPYIQIGDCLLVTESTTAISELYRVTDYGHVLVSEAGNGSAFSATTLQCYHYANVPS